MNNSELIAINADLIEQVNEKNLLIAQLTSDSADKQKLIDAASTPVQLKSQVISYQPEYTTLEETSFIEIQSVADNIAKIATGNEALRAFRSSTTTEEELDKIFFDAVYDYLSELVLDNEILDFSAVGLDKNWHKNAKFIISYNSQIFPDIISLSVKREFGQIVFSGIISQNKFDGDGSAAALTATKVEQINPNSPLWKEISKLYHPNLPAGEIILL